MWALDNRTPFAAERTLLRDASGRELWVVAVKATFTVDPDGDCRPTPAQRPVLRAPRFADAGGAALLLEDANLVLSKPATDVLVSGHAHAPAGKPVRELTVSLLVGPVRKTLVVVGDRTWEGRRPSLSAPEPFVRMPLTYERAFGGVDQRSNPPVTDARNPVGRGFVTEPGHAIGQLVPNFELPLERLVRADQKPPPAGFGPLAPSWSPRLELAGTHDAAWAAQRHPLPPRDQKPGFYCSAPADQQAEGHLRGGEPVVLEHLTPEGTWTFTLPRVVLGFETHFDDGLARHGAVVSTVEIRPDDREVTMTLVTYLPCHRREHLLRGTVVTQKRIVPLGAPRRAGAP